MVGGCPAPATCVVQRHRTFRYREDRCVSERRDIMFDERERTYFARQNTALNMLATSASRTSPAPPPSSHRSAGLSRFSLRSDQSLSIAPRPLEEMPHITRPFFSTYWFCRAPRPIWQFSFTTLTKERRWPRAKLNGKRSAPSSAFGATRWLSSRSHRPDKRGNG